MSDGTVSINGRQYPDRYPPGSGWAIDKSWEIMDSVKEGVIPMDVRCYIAGQIAGALMKERSGQNGR